MPRFLAVGITLAWVAAIPAQPAQETAPRRYGIEANLRDYPQESPKETLASVLRAIDRRRINYLLAQLADPAFVDKRVKEVYGNDFEELVRETTHKLSDNPAEVKQLARFLKDGEWEGGDTTASVKLKDVKDRQVFFHKIGPRWYLENRQKPEPAKTER
jgi:hypothetical protein